jgi:hypothetical protein
LDKSGTGRENAAIWPGSKGALEQQYIAQVAIVLSCFMGRRTRMDALIMKLEEVLVRAVDLKPSFISETRSKYG